MVEYGETSELAQEKVLKQLPGGWAIFETVLSEGPACFTASFGSNLGRKKQYDED